MFNSTTPSSPYRRSRLYAILAVIFGATIVLADSSEAFAQRRGGRGSSRGGSSIRSSRGGGGRSISRGSRGSSMRRSSRPSISRGRSSGMRSSNRSSFRSGSRSSGIRSSNRSGIRRSSRPRTSNRSSFSSGLRSNNRSGIRSGSSRSGIGRSTRSLSGSNRPSSSRFGNRSGVRRSTPSNRSSIRSNNRGNSNRIGTRSTNRSGSRFGNRSNVRSGDRSITRRNSSRSNRFFGNNSGNVRNRSGSNRSISRSTRRSNDRFGNTRFGRGNNRDSARFNRSGSSRFSRGNNARFNRGGSSRFFSRGRFGPRFNGAFSPRRFYGSRFGFPGFGRRYFGFYDGIGFCRFRTGSIFYGHNFFRPYRFSAFSLGIGFGFYGGCLDAPFGYYYPTYYPAWGSPVFVQNDLIIEDEYDLDDWDDWDDDNIVAVAPNQYYEGNTTINNYGTGTAVASESYTPSDPLAQRMQDGAEFFANGNYLGAVRAFEEVTRNDPNNVDGWLALGMSQFATGNYNASADAIRRGLELFPEVVNTVFDVRDRYQNVDDFAEQIQRLEQRVESDRNDVDAHVTLGFVYHFTGQREWSKDVFNYVSSIAPRDQHLARIFVNAKDLPDQARQITPSSVPSADASPEIYDAPTSSMSPVGTTVRANNPPRAIDIRVFEGSVSEEGKGAPRRLLTIDDIIVEVTDVEDEPLRADLEITVGNYVTKYKDMSLGTRVSVRGASGDLYWLSLIEANKDAERIVFTLRQ